jgi:hypothetical protein
MKSEKFGFASLLLLAACQSTPDVATTSPPQPAALKIAVAPVDVENYYASDEEGFYLTASTADALQRRLVRALNESRAASEVFSLASAEPIEALNQGADLLLIPRLNSSAFGPQELSDQAFLSTLLWLTTWAGGLAVEDTTFQTGLQLECDLIDPRSTLAYRTDLWLQTDSVDLDFWDRNDFFSWGTVQTFLLPPFWAGDDEERTSEYLTTAAVTQLAHQLRSYLSSDFVNESSQSLGHIDFLSPENHSWSGTSTALSCEIIGKQPVTGVRYYVNDQLSPVAELDLSQLPAPADQIDVDDSLHHFRLQTEDLDLQTYDDNFIRVEAQIGGIWISRTLVLHAG